MKKYAWKWERIYLCAVIAVTVLAVIPLLALARYSHPSADDYYYASQTYRAWTESHSVLKVLGEAFGTSMDFYRSWQGLYASAFVQSLEPGIFGESYYGLSGMAVLAALYAADIFFAVRILHGKLGAGRLESIAVGCVLAFLMTQWIPSVVQGFYWFNGAANYTLFFCVLLVFVCAVLALADEAPPAKAAAKTTAACAAALLLAGGNHVTAFGGLLFAAGCLVWGAVKKRRPFVRRCIPAVLCLSAGFAVNLLSPGTAVRRAEFTDTPGVAASVIAAVRTGCKAIDAWMGIELLVMLVIMLPFVLSAVRRICENTTFGFGCPLLVLTLSVGFVCALFCPPIYGMGTTGDLRLKNVVYFSFVIMMFVNEYYLCGWLMRRFFVLPQEKGDSATKAAEECISGEFVCVALVLAAGLYLACWEYAASHEAIRLLRSGEAAAYSAEADERYRILVNSAGEDVVLKPFEAVPYLLFYEDITEDADDWRNQWMAEYFGLRSVRTE